ncbi:MAG: Cof-type HAD-IIB family hydrolase, partial [Firmicutes bacterium]|nr:Cof-type HAD-IIB family hydrolase [Bacillota bacterium]
IEAVRLLQENGHMVILSTGRVPSLFYGVDKKLNIDTYIGANGRLVVHKGRVVLAQYIDKETVQKVVDLSEEIGVDIGFESETDYVINSDNSGFSSKFSDIFHLEYPKVVKNYHLNHDILQLVLFYDKPDYKKFENLFPTLSFNYSNPFGIDVNPRGGLKDVGVKALIEDLGLDLKDTIAVGDGFNDISMIQLVEIGIAMGNACQDLKDVAKYVTDDVDNNGIYNIFKKLELI